MAKANASSVDGVSVPSGGSFLSGYTKRHKITIASSQVDADLTDYPVYIDLSELSLGGADIFDTCKTDGSDIRVTKSDETTEVPVEIVDIDTTGKTGELHFLADGTLSSSSDTDFYIYYNGSSSLPARTATYGSDNVWNSNYEGVWHLQEAANNSANGYNDSTGNGNHGTGTSMAETAASITLAGVGQSFDGTNDEIDCGNITALNGATDITMSAWIKYDGTQQNAFGKVCGNDLTDPLAMEFNYTNNDMLSRVNGSNINGTNSTLSSGTPALLVMTYDGANIRQYIDGSEDAASPTAKTGAVNSTAQAFQIGDVPDADRHFGGLIDEVRLLTDSLSANWISTEHNNQNSPGTFYTIGIEETE